HLELFYYVARHEGISNACRHIPYGVQQPAVSSQILKLEEELGTRLFHRKPFSLTEAGQRLYDFSAPFFGQLDDVEKTIRGEVISRLRLAGPTQVMRNHLPFLLAELEEEFPDFQLRLFESDFEHAKSLIERNEIDLAIAVDPGIALTGLRSATLIELPLVLLAPKKTSYKTAKDVIAAGAAGKERLISLRSGERIPALFAQTLRQMKRRWAVSLEVSSTDMITNYVSNGLGIGITVRSPGNIFPKDVKVFELKAFPPLPILLLWRGELSGIPLRLKEKLVNRAASLDA
ncbi:MAG: LysR family transcriptional regulator, partial [Verrucomicrobiota bacterium]